MPQVFVYGTLKRGGRNHAVLAGQRFVATARTTPNYRLYLLDGYPGMVESGPAGAAIDGEVWTVDAACLERLDELEGTAEGLYRRAPVRLQAPHDAAGIETYLYLRGTDGRADLGTNFPV
jgi:gamma-glutamylcyclotransferase (GGCT)/AIG2-like uncharacterized protein YtfP